MILDSCTGMECRVLAAACYILIDSHLEWCSSFKMLFNAYLLHFNITILI